MQMNFKIQNKEQDTLLEYINKRFEEKPKKVYFFCGIFKESGLNILEENFIDTKSDLLFYIGVDKKNTTKTMLELILKYSKNVYMYNNNNVEEYDSNVIVFEYTDSAVILSSNGNISDGGLKENISFYTTVEFDFNVKEEKSMYKNTMKEILKQIETIEFLPLNTDKIKELVDQKQIFSTKQYIHNIKSISEFLGEDKAKEEKKEEKINYTNNNDVIGNITVPKIDLSNMDIDIDIDIDIDEEKQEQQKDDIENDDLKKVNKLKKVEKNQKMEKADKISDDIEYDVSNVEDTLYDDLESETDNILDKENNMYDESLADIDYNENETLDIENLLFSKADIKLDIAKTKSEKKETDKGQKDDDIVIDDEIVQSKKLDLTNVSNLLIQLPEKATKGQDVENIKIPNYIKEMIPDFFEITNKGENVEINSSTVKQRSIELEIVDAKCNKKYTDRNAKMMQKKGSTYLIFTTPILNNIEYNQNDIARIIKLSSNVYHIEIISSDLQEYKLWDKLCNQNMKSISRRYGVM